MADNKAVVLQYVEAFNAGDWTRLRQLFAADAVIQGVLGAAPINEAIPIWKELHESLAIHLTVDSVVADGDTVAARYIERGKAIASFRGNPATGKSYELVAMEWFTLKDGRITRRWGARDSAAQARQLGW